MSVTCVTYTTRSVFALRAMIFFLLPFHNHVPLSPAGQSRANMIPLKQPRHIKASNDTLASIDLDSSLDLSAPKIAPSPPQPPPPLLPKKVPRSCTEPSLGPGGALRPRAEVKPGGSSLSVANPLYDLDSTWETASQSSSLCSQAKRAPQYSSANSLEKQQSNSAPCPQQQAPQERRVFPSTDSLGGRARRPGRGAPPPPAAAGGGGAGGGASKGQWPPPSAAAAAAALYRGFDSWDEVMGRIRGLHADTLRKLAVKCEDRFMAGQKKELRFGTDSWSHFRLTGGEPCCEAGDAVYYTASYAKDPLVSYAIKVRGGGAHCSVSHTQRLSWREMMNTNTQTQHILNTE